MVEQPIPAVKSLNYFHHTHYFLCVRRWCPFFRAIIDIKYKNGSRVSVQFYRAIAGGDNLVFLAKKCKLTYSLTPGGHVNLSRIFIQLLGEGLCGDKWDCLRYTTSIHLI